MCKTFACPCCLNSFFDRCTEIEFESKIYCDNTTPHDFDKRCDACRIVIGTIEKLESLVYQAPFLETSGISGIFDLQGWERNEYEAMLLKKGNGRGWESKADSRAERHLLANKMKQMGLDDVEDARKEHQGYDMALTPPAELEDSVGSNKENEKPKYAGTW